MPGEGKMRLAALRERRMIDTLDAEFAGLLARLHPETDGETLAAAALVSRALREGHTCLPLTVIAERLGQAGHPTKTDRLRDATAASAAVGVDGDAATPLVLTQGPDGGALALKRWHLAETRIAGDLLRRAEVFCEADATAARSLLDRLFPPAPDDAAVPDLQRAAAALALCKRLAILCGGPGTGKTYTLARMLALLAALTPGAPRIALTAPTGRAAKRLGESIRAAAAELPPAFRLDALPEPQTLHRLLGFRPSDGGFARNRERPLPVDMVVVDEASMLDARLLDALLAALPSEARLVLCGDSGQLPPVEPGGLLHALDGRSSRYSAELRARLSALGTELPAAAGPADSPAAPLADCRITLRQTRRFGRESGIFALAHALESEEPSANLAPLLARFSAPGADVDIPEPGAESEARLTDFLKEMLESLHKAQSPEEALAAFARKRVLCALREGRFGEAGLNARCRELLRRIAPASARQDLYRGLPVLILENDYGNRLFNGDAGIIWPDEQGELKAWFEADGGLRRFPPVALPRRQPAYAMTAHKAQGGEFEHVLLVLPEAREDAEDVPLLTRELLYTAVTRAKSRLTLIAPKEQLLAAAGRRFIRHGNLARMLEAGRKPVEKKPMP